MKKIILIFLEKLQGKNLGEVYCKKGGNINGIKDSENGIP